MSVFREQPFYKGRWLYHLIQQFSPRATVIRGNKQKLNGHIVSYTMVPRNPAKQGGEMKVRFLGDHVKD